MKTLTPKQDRFAQEYLNTGNATEAASRAYKAEKRATARAIGSENLTKPNIQAFLGEKASAAASMVYWLSQNSENEAIRLHACRDILDRAGFFVVKSINGTNAQKQDPTIVISFSKEGFEKYS